MAVAQWVVLALTLVTAGLVSFFYNDGHDRQLRVVLVAFALIGAVGTGLFWLGQAMTPPARAIPECDWSDLGEDLTPRCESYAEAASDAAEESFGRLIEDYVVGPVVEAAAVLIGASLGLGAAMLTGRRPTDGRPRRLTVED